MTLLIYQCFSLHRHESGLNPDALHLLSLAGAGQVNTYRPAAHTLQHVNNVSIQEQLENVPNMNTFGIDSGLQSKAATNNWQLPTLNRKGGVLPSNTLFPKQPSFLF